MIFLAKTCCCGCSLRFGSTFIGVLFSMSAFSQAISASIYAASTDFDYVDAKSAVITHAVLSGFMLLCNILLILGSLQDQPSFIRPWLAIYSVLTALYAVVCFLGLVYVMTYDIILGLYLLVIYITMFSIYLYCIIIVYSFYKTILPVAALPQPVQGVLPCSDLPPPYAASPAYPQMVPVLLPVQRDGNIYGQPQLVNAQMSQQMSQQQYWNKS